MDLVTVFYVGFVVGIVAIPILYWLFGPGEAGGDRNRTRNEDVRGERQRRGEERGGSVEETE